MKTILLAALASSFLLGSAGKCDQAKRDYDRYNSYLISASNYSLKSDYAYRAARSLDDVIDYCFISSFEKEGIYKEIDDLKEMSRMFKREAVRIDRRYAPKYNRRF